MPLPNSSPGSNTWLFNVRLRLALTEDLVGLPSPEDAHAFQAIVDELNGLVEWQVALKRGKLKAMAEGPRKEVAKALEKCKAQLRAYVEHPFHVLKNLFKHRKARYRGLAKNTAQLHSLFALVLLQGRML